MSIFDALADPGLSRVLNGDGPIPRAAQLVRRLASLKLDEHPAAPAVGGTLAAVVSDSR